MSDQQPEICRELSKEDVSKIARRIGGTDPIAEKHGLRQYRGSKEEIEEARFPWLKRRRRSS